MDAVSAGQVDGMGKAELRDEMERIEKELLRRLPIGYTTSYNSLVREFGSQGYSAHALDRTLLVLERREVLQFRSQKKVVARVGV
jgi:DNA replication licensing factor MCM5